MKKTMQSIQDAKDIQILDPKKINQIRGGTGGGIIIMIDDLSG